MAAARGNTFSDILSNVLGLLNFESISLREPQVDALRNIFEKKKDVLLDLPTGYGKSLIFWMEVSDHSFSCIAFECVDAGSVNQIHRVNQNTAGRVLKGNYHLLEIFFPIENSSNLVNSKLFSFPKILTGWFLFKTIWLQHLQAFKNLGLSFAENLQRSPPW